VAGKRDDRSETTHENIMSVWDKAIALASKDAEKAMKETK